MEPTLSPTVQTTLNMRLNLTFSREKNTMHTSVKRFKLFKILFVHCGTVFPQLYALNEKKTVIFGSNLAIF